MEDTAGRSAPPGSLGGIVLAGGSGRRFGRPKADVVVAGRSLAARAADALAAHCDHVVVIARPDTPLPHDLDRRVVFDRDGPRAALTAVATGLAALDNEDVLVLGCDLIAAPAVVSALASQPPGQAAALTDEHGVQPLCARYPRMPALDACERLIAAGDLRVRQLVALLGSVLIPAIAGSLTNVNTESDAFEAARRLAGDGRAEGPAAADERS
ncbi:MAG: molybdenum cofactor guanylyltransferase [Acidimicrobiales bacterium]